MASNALKRIFGETKLELKLLMLFAAGLLLIIVTAFWWYGRRMNDLVADKNEDVGRALVDQFKISVHAIETEPNKVDSDRPAPAQPSPDDDRAHRAEENAWVKKMYRDFVTSEYRPKFIYYWKAPNDSGPQDDFEREVCEKYRRAPPQKSENPKSVEFTDRSTKGNKEYQYFQPIYVQESCLGCHASPPGGSGIAAAGPGVPFAARPAKLDPQGWQAGDLMAIAKITIPNQSTQLKLNENWGMLWAVAISTVFLGLLISYAIIRYVIVKPLRHLRDVSDAVTRGNTALCAEIRTGDEFEQLATAFNRMLRTLITSQDELRQANANLDGKVDELAQVNMRLYEMNQLKSEFLATMSHELRTPLNSILGFSEVLAGIESMDERQKRYVQNIQKSGKTLLEMINDILDLAKMESGRMETRLTEFRIQQIIAAQADMVRPLAERKNIDLDVDCDPDLPPLRQDQARVQQILGNLLSNAVKFTPEGGRVTIMAAREADELALRVVDTGVGIAEDDQQVIFEKFRQGKMSVPTGDILAREYSGSGLGLSIVMELCKLLGGQVFVASELGKGSTFTVRLPWTIAEPARPGAATVDDIEQLATVR